MAMDGASWAAHPPMSVAELVAHTKKELDADSADKQAKLQAASVGELPSESQNGSTLDLSRHNISALPVEVIELIKDRVERLALSHNPSVTLPSQIVECDRIRYLNIRWNDLDIFPEVILRLTKLEILDLSKNRIEIIPDGIKNMTNLKFLAVARNQIRRLPLALGEMPSLTKLKFDENPIEFPPLDAISLPKKTYASSMEAEREKETCKAVKAFLKNAAKQRIRTTEFDMSESNAETPRPKRTATIGRFPIRPSVSGIANVPDLRSSSPSDYPPPIPQRSHARVASTASINSMTPPTPKRPGVAPLRTNGNDMMRSRSETAASASLRSRRQGYVPKRDRKVTGELNPLTEAPSEDQERMSQATTIRPMHSRDSSVVSTGSSVFVSSGGETSSGAGSPTEMLPPKFPFVPRVRATTNGAPQRSDAFNLFIKGVKRLVVTFGQLQRPIEEIFQILESVPSSDPRLRSFVAEANASAYRVEDVMRFANNGSMRLSKENLLHRSLQATKAYSAASAAIRRNVSRAVIHTDAIHIRSLMLQIYATMVEARNICTILGHTALQRPSPRDALRTSRAWSSRTVTPTQPKDPGERRERRPTVLQHTSSTATIRPMGPPSLPLHTNGSRPGTMSSMSAATPRSGDSFAPLPSARPHVSRANTMRSMMEVAVPDDQFEQIFLKLRQACEQAAQALLSCRTEFSNRRNEALSVNQPRPASQWAAALSKCEIVSNHNKTLKKRLEMVKVNDPSVRYQRDFWQLCDAFVFSWTDMATEIKDLGSQRGVDVTNVKLIMRHVQKLVKDVSKTISHSPLYHHALGTKMPESAHQSLAPPFPVGLQRSYTDHPTSSAAMGNQNPYITAGPATPLSAALGPAAHTVASTPSAVGQRDYFQDPTQQGYRSAHERNDTVMQAPPRQARRQL